MDICLLWMVRGRLLKIDNEYRTFAGGQIGLLRNCEKYC